ncbi:ribosome biogenesis GTPase Der [Phenylobacterium sp.]|uniref:ribosome biogenesis GTPase Der n=1 Tax=Phenylobacterium sp. TaxID=1871053 RepID=UPI0025FADE8C|nr:ribosome biogenesis GTPase Der [Phenylobacterium sp.]
MALKIAIVGRPNVGKSTLFNRLAGKKLAIVDDQPGVTRDRRFGTGRLGDLDLELIDTAGFEDVTDESLEARMRAQTELAVDEADIALFVIDAREGVTPGDLIFADVLRRKGGPVVLAANKSESKASDAGVLDAYSLGLGEPIPISAEHGEGMADLYAAVAIYALEVDDEPDEAGKPISIAIVGRPNAGKSTLVNRLIGEDRLLVGPEAGITRDAIPVDWTWDDRAIRLVDTAGLRRKAKVQENLEKLSTHDSIRAITFAEVVILVMDATHPFETQDLQIADLVEREGRSLVFVLAKWDLVDDQRAKLAEFIEQANLSLPQLKGSPVVAVSAETGRGLERLMPAVIKSHTDWSTKVKTRDLNDWLKMAVERHPPPSVGGKRVKPKYMAQTKARPPTFVMFASRADQLPDHYRRYLVNSIRESFDLPGVPIRLTVKSNKNPFATGEEKSGTGLTRAKPSEAKTGMAAKIRRAAAAKAKEGAGAKPKLHGKAKPQGPKAKPGNPRGRAAKLIRPGVKPKRASRPVSSPKRPR